MYVCVKYIVLNVRTSTKGQSMNLKIQGNFLTN